MITASYPHPAARLRRHHPARRQLRRRALRPPGPARRRRGLPSWRPADSGGIFTGGEVTYRGVGIGSVGDLGSPTRAWTCSSTSTTATTIPADTPRAGRQPLGGRRAVRRAAAADRRRLPRRRLPDRRTTRAPDRRRRSSSATSPTPSPAVDKQALRTTVGELGRSLRGGTGGPAAIIDTGNSFIETANANFDTHDGAGSATATRCAARWTPRTRSGASPAT